MLTRSSPEPLAEQLSARFAERIRTRLIAPGARLPSVRECARQQGVSPATVREYLDRVKRKYEQVGRPARTKAELWHVAAEDGHVPLIASRESDVDLDYPAVMGSRERLWSIYGEVWGWPPESMTVEEDRIDLRRHQDEAKAGHAAVMRQALHPELPMYWRRGTHL